MIVSTFSLPQNNDGFVQKYAENDDRQKPRKTKIDGKKAKAIFRTVMFTVFANFRRVRIAYLYKIMMKINVKGTRCVPLYLDSGKPFDPHYAI